MAATVFYILITGIVLITVYFSTSPDNGTEPETLSMFPPELGEMNLVDEYSGTKARSEITNMHMGDVEFLEGYVAYYESGTGTTARFWVSTFQSENLASNATMMMTVEIGEEVTPFTVPEEIPVDHGDVDRAYYVTGMGQDHYYWQKGEMVVWLALSNLSGAEQTMFLNLAIERIG